MTSQSPEILRMGGREVELWSTPLDNYFGLAGIEPPFAMESTDLWRCYIGTWELVAKRLYLVAIRASFRDGRDVALADLFPGFAQRVFAHWYTGTLTVPEGEMLERYHGGFGGTPARERVISIERGVEVDRTLTFNGPKKP